MSTPAQLAELRRLARAQHGVIGLAQARAAGLGDVTTGRRLATRAWRPAGVRVVRVGEHDETPASCTVAAMLSIGDAGVLVGRSAPWWWDLHGRPPGAGRGGRGA